jgi:SAM-dependent methyltransferase
MEVEHKANSIAEFYDKRGAAAVRTLSIGRTERIPLPLRAPYDFAYQFVPELPQSRMKDASERPANPVFLDLCCGTGLHSELPANLGYDVIGVDISPTSIMAAKARFASAQKSSERVNFRVGNAVNFLNSAPDGAFEVIFISGSLYYLPLDETLPQIIRTLKPGGKFVCVETFGGNPFMSLIRRFKNLLKNHRDSHTLNSLLGSQEVKLMQNAFPVSSIRYFDSLTLFSSLLSLNSQTLQKCLRPIDNFLLNKLKLKCLAFKFVFVGIK